MVGERGGSPSRHREYVYCAGVTSVSVPRHVNLREVPKLHGINVFIILYASRQNFCTCSAVGDTKAEAERSVSACSPAVPLETAPQLKSGSRGPLLIERWVIAAEFRL